MSRSGSRFRRLPLFWKLLVPFLALVVVVGSAGTFVVVRDLANRTQSALDADLSRRSLDARSTLRDRELYLIETATFAANEQGMAAAVHGGDAERAAQLLSSVVALKSDVELLAVTGITGRGLAEYRRTKAADRPRRDAGTDFRSGNANIAAALLDTLGTKHAGFLTDQGGTPLLVIAAPVCAAGKACEPIGAVVVGISASALVSSAAQVADTAAPDSSRAVGVSLFDLGGRLIARSGAGPSSRPPELVGNRQVRVASGKSSERTSTLYLPYDVQGERRGTLGVAVPSASVFSSVRGTARQLTVVVLLVMLGVVALGAALSKLILRQVSSLLRTTRALGAGAMAARVEVVSDDELGEVAESVNLMADQLQANYETLELRVEERTEEVRRLLRERTDFFASLSHEFRTPLAVILGQVSLLRGSGTVEEVATTIRESGEQLLDLVNEILEIAKAEADRLEIDAGDVQLDHFLRRLKPTLLGLTASAGLTLSMTVPDDLPVVRAEERRVREIVLNLVDNAVKYTPSPGRVDISAEATAGGVTVEVADTGVGIPADAAAYIFEPFYRVKGTRTQRGEPSSGLGLALTQRLVQAHGGTISFNPREGGGTVFRFMLPAHHDPAVHQPDRPGAKRGSRLTQRT